MNNRDVGTSVRAVEKRVGCGAGYCKPFIRYEEISHSSAYRKHTVLHCAHVHTHRHARTHYRTHTHTHTYRQTHTHTHTVTHSLGPNDVMVWVAFSGVSQLSRDDHLGYAAL